MSMYSMSIFILGDTDIHYSVSKEYNEYGDFCIKIDSNGEEKLVLSMYDAKHLAKALGELVHGY